MSEKTIAAHRIAADPVRRRLLQAGLLAAAAGGVAPVAAARAQQATVHPGPDVPDTGLELERPVIGFLVYPDMFLQDLVGPLTVFESLMARDIHLLWKQPGAIEVTRERGMPLVTVHATTALDDCPADLDVLVVPGGVEGTFAAMTDPAVLAFLAAQAPRTRFLASVCTGSLVLGAAGLLDGYRATTYWALRDVLPAMGAIPADGRVVRDRNRITAGGVTAGIDFGLYLVSLLRNRFDAESIQLYLEYDPAPPFDAGHPRSAPEPVTRFIDGLFDDARRQAGERIERARRLRIAADG